MPPLAGDAAIERLGKMGLLIACTPLVDGLGPVATPRSAGVHRAMPPVDNRQHTPANPAPTPANLAPTPAKAAHNEPVF